MIQAHGLSASEANFVLDAAAAGQADGLRGAKLRRYIVETCRAKFAQKIDWVALLQLIWSILQKWLGM